MQFLVPKSLVTLVVNLKSIRTTTGIAAVVVELAGPEPTSNVPPVIGCQIFTVLLLVHGSLYAQASGWGPGAKTPSKRGPEAYGYGGSRYASASAWLFRVFAEVAVEDLSMSAPCVTTLRAAPGRCVAASFLASALFGVACRSQPGVCRILVLPGRRESLRMALSPLSLVDTGPGGEQLPSRPFCFTVSA